MKKALVSLITVLAMTIGFTILIYKILRFLDDLDPDAFWE